MGRDGEGRDGRGVSKGEGVGGGLYMDFLIIWLFEAKMGMRVGYPPHPHPPYPNSSPPLPLLFFFPPTRCGGEGGFRYILFAPRERERYVLTLTPPRGMLTPWRVFFY